MYETIISEQPDNINPYTNKTTKKIILPNGNTIQVLTLLEQDKNKRQQAYGNAPSTAEIIMIFWDEYWQFDEVGDDYFISAAARSAFEKERYSFYISNPINKDHWLVKKFESLLPFNLSKLKNPPYYQNKIVGEKFIFYNNYLFIKNSLNQQKIDTVEKLPLKAPHLKPMILWGMPGSTPDSIFTKLLNLIKYPSNFRPSHNAVFYAGIDFGESKSLTAATFWCIDEKQIYLLAEKKIVPNEGYSLDDDDIELYNFIKSNYINYGLLKKGLNVMCDFETARIRRLISLSVYDNFGFMATVKHRIKSRVHWWISQLAQGKVNICFKNSEWLRELMAREYETNPQGEPDIKPGNDHFADSGDYAFGLKMKEIQYE